MGFCPNGDKFPQISSQEMWREEIVGSYIIHFYDLRMLAQKARKFEKNLGYHIVQQKTIFNHK